MANNDILTTRFSSCICGYHIHQSVWDPVIGELLECNRKSRNAMDRYAVSVTETMKLLGICPRRFPHCAPCFFDVGVQLVVK